MLRALLLTFAFMLLSLVNPIQLSWLLGAQAQEDSYFELLRQSKLQEIKSRIMKEFGITEGPVLNDSQLRLSAEVIKKMFSLYESKTTTEPEDENSPKMMIFPDNAGNFSCEWSDEPSCRRFEYNLSPKAEFSSSEFWFRKLQSSPGDNLTLSVLCSDPDMTLMKKTDLVNLKEETEEWEIYQLITAAEKLPSRIKEVWCHIETYGVTVDDSEDNLPLMKADERDSDPKRRRRDEEASSSTQSPNTCRSTPLNFSFEELGIDHHIVHPPWFMTSMCEGYCHHAQTQHEGLMEMYFRHHPELPDNQCWATCCRPTEYQSMTFIYHDNNTRVIRNMTKAIVTRCECR